MNSDERLRRARLLGSFIAYYHAGREWYPDWFNGLSRGDQEIVFQWMLGRRQRELELLGRKKRCDSLSHVGVLAGIEAG